MGVTPIKVPQSLAIVLNSAGERSGVDFDYLLQTAIRESSLNPSAKASTSSATGLFQFIDSTWLQVMKEQGPRLGYQNYADAITQDRDGDYVIKDKELRKEILKLREDPQVASDLAAAFTRSNSEYLYEKFGRRPSPGELYIAHFLGAKGAEKMFTAGLADPDQIAAKLFPKQARANPTIFYDQGEARTIRDVYQSLVAKHLSTAPAIDPTVDANFTVQQLAGEPLPTGNLTFELPEFEVPPVGTVKGESPVALPTEVTSPLAPVETGRSLIAYADDGTPLVEKPEPLVFADDEPVELLPGVAKAAVEVAEPAVEAPAFDVADTMTEEMMALVAPEETLALTGEIPSRYSAQNLAVAAANADNASSLPRTLLTSKGWEANSTNAGFITRLYGQ